MHQLANAIFLECCFRKTHYSTRGYMVLHNMRYFSRKLSPHPARPR